jgi:hypothetical protein
MEDRGYFYYLKGNIPAIALLLTAQVAVYTYHVWGPPNWVFNFIFDGRVALAFGVVKLLCDPYQEYKKNKPPSEVEKFEQEELEKYLQKNRKS